MAQNVIINGVTYADVPAVHIPKSGGGTAVFTDTADSTLSNSNQLLSGVTAYSNGTLITGSIPSKAAETYTPSTADQAIASGQYLSGVQTIRGDTNLVPANILQNVSIFGVTGTLALPSISQDSTTKVLSIS